MNAVGRLLLSVAYPVEAAVHAVLAAVASVVPFRDEDCWVFGAREGGGFADNPKYLFVHVVEAHPEIRAVWLSRKRGVVRDLRSRGYEAYHVWSPRGVWLTLGAGVAVLSHSTRDVNRWFLGGATLAQLWHGVPLKTVSWDAELADLPPLARLGLRSLYRRYHIVTVPGSEAVDPLASGLDLDRDRFVVTGYPRNDALLGAFPDEAPVVDEDALARLRRLGESRPLVLYLPTFRETGVRAADRLPVDHLATTLADHDAVLVVKFHPSENVGSTAASPATDHGADDSGATSTRIHVLPSDVDVSPLLSEVDVLVTDYSSALFDYLLLDRPIVFFPYDLEQYAATRGFYFDYDAITPGAVARTDADLSAAIRRALSGDGRADARSELRERFLSDAEPGSRSEAVVRAIRERQRTRRPTGANGF